MSEEGITTVEVKIIVTERESEPGALSVHIERPENIVMALGIIELAKAKLTQPQPKEQPLVMPVPGIDLNRLKIHRGKG